MRFSPTRFLHGLRFTAPVLLLTLAACGGGGGGGSSTPAPTYSLGGSAITGLTGTGLVLKNLSNSDTKAIAATDTSYVFGTQLTAGASYNVTVQTQPSGQICTVAHGTGTMTSAGVSNANVTCLDSFTLGGNLTGVPTRSSSMVLRNNGGDDLTVAATDTTYVFATPVANSTTYNVSVLSQPGSASSHELCTIASPTGTMPSNSVNNVDINCASAYTIGGTSGGGGGITGLVGKLLLQNTTNGDLLSVAGSGTTDFTFNTPVVVGSNTLTVLSNPYAQSCSYTTPTTFTVSADKADVAITCTTAAIPSLDQYAYVANYNSNSISAYDITAPGVNGGLLTPLGSYATITDGLNTPSSIVVNSANSVAYVTNAGTNRITAYSISSGILTLLSDVDAGTSGNQDHIATGAGPYVIKLHPTGKYAYVVNATDKTISGYSIDASGKLASIDTDGDTTATQTSITTGGNTPTTIAIHPGGAYAYVVNYGSNKIRGYSIDAHTGALSFLGDYSTGTQPYSITIDPTGRYAYVANSGSASISGYTIGANGALTAITCSTTCTGGNFMSGTTPRSITIDPSGKFVYVANNGSSSVSAYSIVDATGQLTLVGTKSTELYPYAIRIDNSGTYAYVAHYTTSPTNVWTFSINSNGSLNTVGQSQAGSSPDSIATSQ